MIATPDDGVTYFQPYLAVDGAGRVAISAFALANGHINEVLFLSRPHKLRFGPPLRVTTAPSTRTAKTPTGTKHGAWWIGDYQGIAASAGGTLERHPHREAGPLRGHGTPMTRA